MSHHAKYLSILTQPWFEEIHASSPVERLCQELKRDAWPTPSHFSSLPHTVMPCNILNVLTIPLLLGVVCYAVIDH